MANVGKFIAIGLIAPVMLPSRTCQSLGDRRPQATSSLTGPNDQVMLPQGSVKSDWEVELGIIIGKRAAYVAPEVVLDHVAGYCVVNDVSEREYQIERGGSWDKGKGCDTFGPVGPWLVTKDEVPDPQALAMWLDETASFCRPETPRP